MAKWLGRFLIGGGAVAAAAALLAWGSLSQAVDTHLSVDGLHMTVAQATATAERVTRIEEAAAKNSGHLEQIDRDVMAIQEDISEIKEAQQQQAIAAERTSGDIRVILEKLNEH